MNCKEGTVAITSQICALLEAIDDQDYAKPLPIFNGSSIGQHIRHLYDFYNCLLNGLPSGVVDYASRQRDPSVEIDTCQAMASLQKITNQLMDQEEKTPIQVLGDFSYEDDNQRPVVQSSIGRELMFAYDHAVHHLAIVKIGIKSAFPHLPIADNLGVAPSTVKYTKVEEMASK